MKKVKRLNEMQVRELLSKAIQEAGSQANFADSNGMSRQYLTDVIKGRRDLSGKILEALNLEKIIEFQHR
jgi:hypothetical protein